MGVYIWTQPIIYTYQHQELQNEGMGVYTRTQPITYILHSEESLCVLSRSKSNLMKFWVFTLGPSPESSITTITRKVKVLPHRYINTSLPSIIVSCSQDVM